MEGGMIMADREKVIKGLEILTNRNGCEYIHCDDCCFYISTKPTRCGLREEQIQEDALALLKEQEAKWVEDKHGGHCRLIKCSNCGLTFIVGNNIPYDEWIEDRNYCRRCGARMVKRND